MHWFVLLCFTLNYFAGMARGRKMKRPIIALLVFVLMSVVGLMPAAAETKFKRISPHFIAALGDPQANSGTGAETWGYWSLDPGKNGVWLSMYKILKAAGGYGPGNWKFDDNDWWLDENGLLMQKPEFPMAPGKYLVTGEREVTTTLTVHPKDADGNMRWELADKAALFDVTHMPCRSARYRPVKGAAAGSCTPSSADKSHFKVAPGSLMPAVPGCEKLDYSVLIVIGLPVES